MPALRPSPRRALFGLRWFEWSAFLLVPALVLLVGLAACVLPVRQVLRQTALTALREER